MGRDDSMTGNKGKKRGGVLIVMVGWVGNVTVRPVAR